MNPTLAPDVQETNRVFEEEVVAHRNLEALDRVYTQNARVMPPGSEMILGLQNIKSFWQTAMNTMGLSAVKLQTIGFEPLGTAGVEIGRARLEFAAGEPPTEVKYVVVWKQEDGDWKWHVDMWSPVS
jgi:ketosteroid isomerase-like protein